MIETRSLQQSICFGLTILLLLAMAYLPLEGDPNPGSGFRAVRAIPRHMAVFPLSSTVGVMSGCEIITYNLGISTAAQMLCLPLGAGIGSAVAAVLVLGRA